jgi:hypothetical protein
MLRTSTCTTVAAGLLAVLASASATAGDNWPAYDQTHMTGAQCQPSTGSQWPDFLVNPDGIRNNATANRYISCALPWLSDATIDQSDYTSSTPSGYVKVSLSFDASQGGGSTSCTLFGRPNDTLPVQSQTSTVTLTKNTTIQYLHFTNSAALNGLNPAYYAAQASLNCRLPAKVKLLSIHVWQADQTTNYRYTP